jgi:long-chain acyl-CoA synthetase
MVREADAEQFVDSIMHGLRANHSEEQLAQLKLQIDALMAMIRKVGTSQKGAIIVLDYMASSDGTTLFVDGKAAGGPMAGEEFFRALMRIWLGENPAEESLKKALLGQS